MRMSKQLPYLISIDLRPSIYQSRVLRLVYGRLWKDFVFPLILSLNGWNLLRTLSVRPRRTRIIVSFHIGLGALSKDSSHNALYSRLVPLSLQAHTSFTTLSTANQDCRPTRSIPESR